MRNWDQPVCNGVEIEWRGITSATLTLDNSGDTLLNYY